MFIDSNAWWDGWDAYFTGDDINPFPKDTESYKEWNYGYDEASLEDE